MHELTTYDYSNVRYYDGEMIMKTTRFLIHNKKEHFECKEIHYLLMIVKDKTQ